MWVLHVCESASVHNPSDDRGRAVGPACVEILRRRDVVRADNRGQLGAHHGRAVGGRCAIHGRRDDWRADSAGEQRGEYSGPAALEAAIVMQQTGKPENRNVKPLKGFTLPTTKDAGFALLIAQTGSAKPVRGFAKL